MLRVSVVIQLCLYTIRFWVVCQAVLLGSMRSFARWLMGLLDSHPLSEVVSVA